MTAAVQDMARPPYPHGGAQNQISRVVLTRVRPTAVGVAYLVTYAQRYPVLCPVTNPLPGYGMSTVGDRLPLELHTAA